MKRSKQLIALVLALVMVVSMVPAVGAYSARTTAPASSNAYFYSSSNPFYSTYVGWCTWYAFGRAYEILGSRPQLSTGAANKWYAYNQNNGYYPYGSTPQIGSVACWFNNGNCHVAVVEDIVGGIPYVSEFNVNSDRQFHYLPVTKHGWPDGYIYITNNTSAPTNAWINASKTSVAIGESITFTFGANNAAGYVLGIDKEDVGRVSTPNVDSRTSYTTSFSEAGTYSVYVTCWNSVGGMDSSPIKFTVYGAPTNAWINASKTSVAIGESITFTFGANNAAGYVLGIDKEGVGRVSTPNVDSRTSYTTSFSEAGTYSVYVTCWNSIGGMDSSPIKFTVYGAPTSTWVKASCGSAATTADNVTLTWGATGASGFWLDVWHDGDHIMTKGMGSDTSYVLSSLAIGHYGIFITATNNVGREQKLIEFDVTGVAPDPESSSELSPEPKPEPEPEPEPSTPDTTNTPAAPSSSDASATPPSSSNSGVTGTPGTGASSSTIFVHFPRVNVYHQDQFTDVKANQWFTPTIASAFEMGLVKGDSSTTYNPYGNVTVAEAITMAARIHSIYTTGKEGFVQSGKWYQVYLDYAYYNDIISVAYYNSDVNQNATRAQFAEIFAGALPDEGLYPINTVTDNAIPDVKMSANYAASVYKLYRAGILAGSDRLGTFNPDTYITRAEAATILARMGESSNRKSFTMD